MAKLELVKEDKYNVIGILGEPTEVGSLWLQMQEIPFSDDAEFVTLYPISGGAMVVDKNKLTYIGHPTEEQMNEILGKENYSFNPAADTILKMVNYPTLKGEA